MGSAVLTISDEVKAELKRFSWVNWSELAREELIKREESARAWHEAGKIVAKSKMTQAQADKLSDKTNWALSRRYEKLLRKGS